MKICLLTFLFFLSTNPCSRVNSENRSPEEISEPSAQVKILAVKESNKYKIACIFYGREVVLSGGNVRKYVQYITLQDQSSGKEVKYIPFDKGSEEATLGLYFYDVWSPDEEYLILPRGEFHGFCINKSARAMELVSEQKCSDHIRIQMSTGTYLWHNFKGWVNDTAFEFEAGLSGTMSKFSYDVASEKLTPSEKGRVTAENKTGLFEVSH